MNIDSTKAVGLVMTARSLGALGCEMLKNNRISYEDFTQLMHGLTETESTLKEAMEGAEDLTIEQKAYLLSHQELGEIVLACDETALLAKVYSLSHQELVEIVTGFARTAFVVESDGVADVAKPLFEEHIARFMETLTEYGLAPKYGAGSKGVPVPPAARE